MNGFGVFQATFSKGFGACRKRKWRDVVSPDAREVALGAAGVVTPRVTRAPARGSLLFLPHPQHYAYPSRRPPRDVGVGVDRSDGLTALASRLTFSRLISVHLCLSAVKYFSPLFSAFRRPISVD